MSEDHRSRIAALDKALAVLEAFGPAAPDLRIADHAALTGMNRSSAQRVTHTLVRCGYLHRDEVSLALSLTYRSACIAHTFISTNHLIDLAMPALVDLSARTHLRADLWVMQGADIVNIARVPSAADSRAMAPIGERLPALASAPGRAMVSRLPAEVLAERIAELAEASDPVLTPAEQAACEHAFTDAAARGYVLEAGSTVNDETTISAAVLDADGECLAAVSVSGWLGEVNEDDLVSQFVQPVLATARALSNLRIQTWSRAVSRPAEGKDALAAPEEDEDDPLFIASVARGFRVLEAFTPANSVPTLTALHRLTGLPVATVQRIVDTLMACGYVEKDARHKTFRLTVKTLDMLFNFQMSNRIIKTIWPRLVQLRDPAGFALFRFAYWRDKRTSSHAAAYKASPPSPTTTLHSSADGYRHSVRRAASRFFRREDGRPARRRPLRERRLMPICCRSRLRRRHCCNGPSSPRAKRAMRSPTSNRSCSKSTSPRRSSKPTVRCSAPWWCPRRSGTGRWRVWKRKSCLACCRARVRCFPERAVATHTPCQNSS